MAKSKRILSFHTTEALQHTTHGFSILQSSLGEARQSSTLMHSHAFWQLEFILSGSCTITHTKGEHLLQTGDYVLIPPTQEHLFDYGKKNCAYMSTKFTWTLNPTETQHTKIGSTAPLSFLPYIKEMYQQCEADNRQLVGFSSAILAHILTLFPETPSSAQPASNLVTAVSNIIHQHQGRPVAIKQIAQTLRLSVNHLSARYASEAGITLKQSIDDYRCEIAKQLLRHEEDSISQIANFLEFPDVFSFSRFFYRVTGMRPKNFRNCTM